MNWIHVAGSSRPFEMEARRRAYSVGLELARANFGLVAGNTAGVDAFVTEGFRTGARRLQRNESDCFLQVRRKYLPKVFWPGKRHRASADQIFTSDGSESLEDAIVTRCAAVIIIGGTGGRSDTIKLARKFMSARKPVFPIPFSGGRSGELFQELLRDWREHPIPNLTRNQVLRLALPWVQYDAAPLVQMLQGALADCADIFVSYRRSDNASAAGRIQRDLADHFGKKRIFLDEEHIEPSDEWRKSIDSALEKCRAGLVVIGSNWVSDRMANDDDVMRREVAYLLRNKAVVPVLVHGAELPAEDKLPDDLKQLLRRQALKIDNANWDLVLANLIKKLEAILGEAQVLVTGSQVKDERS